MNVIVTKETQLVNSSIRKQIQDWHQKSGENLLHFLRRIEATYTGWNIRQIDDPELELLSAELLDSPTATTEQLETEVYWDLHCALKDYPLQLAQVVRRAIDILIQWNKNQ